MVGCLEVSRRLFSWLDEAHGILTAIGYKNNNKKKNIIITTATGNPILLESRCSYGIKFCLASGISVTSTHGADCDALRGTKRETNPRFANLVSLSLSPPPFPANDGEIVARSLREDYYRGLGRLVGLILEDGPEGRGKDLYPIVQEGSLPVILPSVGRWQNIEEITPGCRD